MTEVDYIPKNQLTIFDMLDEPEEIAPAPAEECNKFRVDRVHWHQQSHLIKHMPRQYVGHVVGLIPEYVKAPTEDRSRSDYPTSDYSEMLDTWSTYVWAVACTIPRAERAEHDANGWLKAKEMLKAAREQKEPIKLEIWDHVTGSFRDLEVIEYSPIPEGAHHVTETIEQPQD